MHAKRRNFMILIIYVGLLSGAGLATEHDTKLAPGKYGRVRFPTAVQLGQRLLPAGLYEFHCFHKGQYHLMAVYRASSDPGARTAALGKPFATAYCQMEALTEPVRRTSVVTTNDASGNVVLDEIRIQGEPGRHIFREPVQLDPGKMQSTLDLLQFLILRGGHP